MRGSLCFNVPIGIGGVGDPPLTCLCHTFWIQKLILPSLISMAQTMPVYSVSRSCSNLSSASPFVTRSSLFVDSIAPFDLGLAPSSSGLLYTDSGVVEDLLIRSTTCSVFPSWMDWCGPPGPSISYTAPIPSGPTVSISRYPFLSIQRFYQDFKLFDVASSTTFVTGNTQTELHCAITRLIYVFFIYIYGVLIFIL